MRARDLKRKSVLNQIFKIIREKRGDLFKGYRENEKNLFLSEVKKIASEIKLKIYQRDIEEAYKKHFERIRKREEEKGLNPLEFLEIKKDTQEFCKKRMVIQDEYTLDKEKIMKYLMVVAKVNKKIESLVREYTNFDKKKRGAFLKFNILATGGGYFIAQQFWYAQWKSKFHSTSRKNYYFCGWTDRGYFFAHPVSGQRVWDALQHEAWWEQMTKSLRNYRKPVAEQGEYYLVKTKKTRELEPCGNTLQIENHAFNANQIYKYKGSYYVEGPGTIVHINNRHNVVNIPQGFYKICKNPEVPTWDFGAVRVD